MDVDQAGPGRSPLRQNHKIDISPAAVGIRDRFRIVVQLFGRVDGALFYFDDLTNFLHGRFFVTGERQFVDVI